VKFSYNLNRLLIKFILHGIIIKVFGVIICNAKRGKLHVLGAWIYN
jgi:hypothetical protein